MVANELDAAAPSLARVDGVGSAGVRQHVGPAISGAQRIGRFLLSVPVVVVVAVLPMRIPFPAGILIMAPVPIGVANPSARMSINLLLTIF
jgi:hypothetical protein